MSGEFPDLASELKKHGFNIIYSEIIENSLAFECRHADMQCLKINDNIFILKDCRKLGEALIKLNKNIIYTAENISENYPKNILLNAVYLKNKLFCKENAIDANVKLYCDKNNIDIINVNQGYTKCSTTIIGDAIITSDKGIFDAMGSSGVEGLLISQGDIELDKVDYGFIGGCCFCYGDVVYFTGNVKKHPDYYKINSFCKKFNKEIVCLSDRKLYDIGGFVVI